MREIINPDMVQIGDQIMTECLSRQGQSYSCELGSLLVTDIFKGGQMLNGIYSLGSRTYRLYNDGWGFSDLGVWIPDGALRRGEFEANNFRLFFRQHVSFGSELWLPTAMANGFLDMVEEITAMRSVLVIDN